MQAVRFVGVGRSARIEDVPKPSPGPGQVLVKIGGADWAAATTIFDMAARHTARW